MATPINQTRSVKYDPVPFATTATVDSLQQHESIMSAFARHRDALRRRAADTPESPPSRTWGPFLAFLGVICVSPDSMLLRSMYAAGASTPAVVSAKYFGVALLLTLVAAVYPSKVRRAFTSPPHFVAAVLYVVPAGRST